MKYSLIDPKLKPSYSPNLFRWMRKQQRGSRSIYKEMRVFQMEGEERAPESLFIGTVWDERMFGGSRMSGVLCYGGMEPLNIFSDLVIGENLIDITAPFWSEYLILGRCAIDPRHKTYFISGEPRYFFPEENVRICKWCNAVFTKHIVERIETDIVWKPLL